MDGGRRCPSPSQLCIVRGYVWRDHGRRGFDDDVARVRDPCDVYGPCARENGDWWSVCFMCLWACCETFGHVLFVLLGVF